MTVRHALVPTVLGELTVSADGDALTGLYFPAHSHPPAPERLGMRVEPAGDALLSAAAEQLKEYLAGDRRVFDLPLRTGGDAFSERVWARLRAIDYGDTVTYGALAEEMGNRHLAQRVGYSVGHNPISIIIPCHRVLGADGALTGFAGGLARKRRLLALEEPDAEQAGRLF